MLNAERMLSVGFVAVLLYVHLLVGALCALSAASPRAERGETL
jgi:hypothetical protein